MHKPSYNEIAQGFGFTNVVNTLQTPTATFPDGFLQAYLQSISNPGSVRQYTGTTVTLNNGNQYGVGAVVGIDQDDREAYTFQITAAVDKDCLILPFVGTIEAGLTDYMGMYSKHFLCASSLHKSGTATVMSAKGFLRPSVALNSYANASSVTGLGIGAMIVNLTGGNLSVKHDVSVDVNRWDRIDNELISVVQ